jgi:mannose/fructose-specific phosphotransferase system component IIA
VTRGLILTHGELGRALLEAAEKVLGPQTDVEVLSNEGLSLEQIIHAVKARLGTEPCLLMVDFFGGSPFVACRALLEQHPLAAVISGVNLPMLFSFFTKRATLDFHELATMVEADAHRGIQRISA